MLYTGYFAKTNKYIENGFIPVSVAGKTPDFFLGRKWTVLAPRKEMFDLWKSKKITNEEYAKMYTDYLDTLKDRVFEVLKSFADEDNVVMCCYEKSSDFCHRHILAEYLTNKKSIMTAEKIL